MYRCKTSVRFISNKLITPPSKKTITDYFLQHSVIFLSTFLISFPVMLLVMAVNDICRCLYFLSLSSSCPNISLVRMLRARALTCQIVLGLLSVQNLSCHFSHILGQKFFSIDINLSLDRPQSGLSLADSRSAHTDQIRHFFVQFRLSKCLQLQYIYHLSFCVEAQLYRDFILYIYFFLI